MKSVCILIPAYNAARTIGATLASIQQQPSEVLSAISMVLVVDDCSRDDTAAIARSAWHQPHPALQVRIQSHNGGERRVCNEAFRSLLADGHDWCLVLHADDIAKDHWLDTMLQAIRSIEPHTASICSSWDNLYSGGRIVPGEDDPERAPERIEGNLQAALGTLQQGCWWHFSGCAMHLPTFAEGGRIR